MTIPVIGDIEIPNEITAQLVIPAPIDSAPVIDMTPAFEFAPAQIPLDDPEVAGRFEFRPVTFPGRGESEATGLISIPETAIRDLITPAIGTRPIPAAAPVEPAPVAAPTAATSDSRSVSIAGVGEFLVPNGIPALTGIPGLTDSAAVPAPMPGVTPQKTHGQRAVEAARSKLGANYRTGGAGPDSFDCSGFVQWSYREAGVDLPRTSYSQLEAGTPVPLDELEPGDLVSYYGGGHSALYAGEGQVIHASTYGSGVKMSPVDNMPVTGARRF
ncbi:C40 family peptidase [Nocardia jejuensis]|uniref:C40 family peptidase n=1 Tax=Nocardia jejuensis TaxID=328049 RepID=UPI001FDF3471|nr:C40 family peptidase [Nocardia jejuensis]